MSDLTVPSLAYLEDNYSKKLIAGTNISLQSEDGQVLISATATMITKIAQSVGDLPIPGDSSIRWLVPKTGGGYNMYMWVDELEDYILINDSDVDLSDYQKKTDTSLSTTSKTIVGAINEVNNKTTVSAGTGLSKSGNTINHASSITSSTKGGTKNLQITYNNTGHITSVTEVDLHPVGSIYTTSTNTNPSSTLGGTWELIDKKFKNKIYNTASASEVIECDGTISSFYSIIHGNTVSFTLFMKPTKSLVIDDNTKYLAELDCEQMGFLPNMTIYTMGFCDDANIIFPCSLQWKSDAYKIYIQSQDCFGTSGTSVKKSHIFGGTEAIHIDAMWNISKDTMYDEYCDQFIWKRTA